MQWEPAPGGGFSTGEPWLPLADDVESRNVALQRADSGSLLCLYRGTETFYVRCRPFRRGCIVLRNGEYELAVLTASDKILPYRARIAFSSEVMKSVYRIDDDPRGDDLGVLGTRAEYTFLRVPDDVGDLTIDPRTGSVRQRH